MQNPPFPPDELTRLNALRELLVLDTPSEPLLDSITQMAAETCGTPISLISLIDDSRQWFKSNIGLPGVSETPREIAFCAHAIVSDAVMEVSDAQADPRFVDNPLVTDEPRIRFYAGAPIIASDGSRVGTLCVIDRTVRQLSAAQLQTLQSLSRMAAQALVMRRDLLLKAFSIRKQYELKLAESEARYRSVVEDQHELVSLSWPDGELFFVNHAYAARFGMLPADLVGRSLYEFVEPSERETVRGTLTQVITQEMTCVAENRMTAADGSELWVSWTNRCLRDGRQRPYLHSVGRDVTAEKRAMRALRASQQLLGRTGQVARVGGWELELPSNRLHWTDETRRIHEVDESYEPELDSAVAFYAPGARETIAQAVAVAVATGTPWDLELPLITARGRSIWVRAAGEVDYDEHGQAVRMFGVFQDITERREMARQIEESERFVREVTDALPVRIAYLDRERRFRFSNRAQCERMGRPRDQVLGATRQELHDIPTDPPLDAFYDAVLRGEPQRFECWETLGDARRRIELQLIPDLRPDGVVHGFFSTGVDVTERVRVERELRLLTDILNNTSDYVMQTTAQGQVVYMNQAVRKALGVPVDAPVGHFMFTQFNTETTNQRYRNEIVPAIKARGVWVGETMVLAAGGREVPVSHMVIAHRNAQGRMEHVSAVMRDISDVVAARQALLRQTAALRSLTEALPAMVAVVGNDLVYRFVNTAFEQWHHLSRDQVLGHTMPEQLGADEYERSRPSVERVLAGETVLFEKAYPERQPPSHLAIQFVPLRSDDGQVDGFVAFAQDITAHRKEAGRLLELAHRDPLTGLFNRAGLSSYVEQRLGQDQGRRMALICLDLDRFKPVNDQYGHPAGDELLRLFAKRLKALVRPTDAVARLGGDEFAVVLGDIPQFHKAQSITQNIIDMAHQPFELQVGSLLIGASAGLAYGVHAEHGWDGLMQRADTLLYEAKETGRGRYRSEGE